MIIWNNIFDIYVGLDFFINVIEYNKFNQLFLSYMSASLPRIKILTEGGKLKTVQSQKELKLKFKKLLLNDN